MNSELKTELTKLHRDTSEEVVSVGWGRKITGGSKTEEQCVMFGVRVKKPLDEIPEEERIPSTITIEGTDYKTDVIEVGPVEAAACDQTTLDNCYGWQTTSPTNQNYTRPIKGGLRIASKTIDSVSSQGGSGTLGLVAVDTATNSLVGITNAHVGTYGLTGPGEFYQNLSNPNVSQWRVKKRISWINQGTNYAGATGILPASENPYDDLKVHFDGGGTINPAYYLHHIGRVIRHIPIYGYNAPDAPAAGYVGGVFYNDVDVAVVGLYSSVVDVNESWKQHDLGVVTSPPEWASTSEIDNLVSTDPYLYSSGATTGAKGDDPCRLKVLSVGTNVSVAYLDTTMVPSYARFKNVIAFTRENADCTYPIWRGDSGSSLLANIGGTVKVIGLVFATGLTIGYAVRIDEVASIAEVSRWDGGATNFLDLANPQVITLSGNQNGGGATPWKYGDYWYAGFYSSSAATPLHLL